jgi:hypothetical protein
MRRTLGKTQKAKFIGLLSAFLIFYLPGVFGQIAAGGSYTLQKSVVAGGGASGVTITGAGYTLEGTIGQCAVGAANQNAPYKLHPGFWSPASFAPTAASITLGGRVLTADGRGIINARVALTMPSGETRYVVSSSFGYYRFAGVPVGETYILTTYSKRFTFKNAIQGIILLEEPEDVDFITAENR